MLRSREDLEQIERGSLASYAVYSEDAVHSHKESPPLYRTFFQRDWHRIIHSEAYRRLDSKTQVFPFGEGNDASRDRLSHTSEVVQIATSLARTFGLNEDLTRSIALAHDLGHTPFGHGGEETLDCLLKNYGGFEHNRQSFRVVTELEVRYPEFSGLNLTTEVLDGIERHDTDYDLKTQRPHFFRDSPGPSLEAQVVSAADVIAFRAHDLEDGLNMGILRESRAQKELSRVSLYREAEERAQLALRKIRFQEDYQRVWKAQITRMLIDLLMQDVLRETKQKISEQGIKTARDARKSRQKTVSFGSAVSKKLDELKSFLENNFYSHHKIARSLKKGKGIIEYLFGVYSQNTDLLPGGIRIEISRRKERGDKPGGKRIIREVVADYIAGMTDRYAIEQYKKISAVG